MQGNILYVWGERAEHLLEQARKLATLCVSPVWLGADAAELEPLIQSGGLLLTTHLDEPRRERLLKARPEGDLVIFEEKPGGGNVEVSALRPGVAHILLPAKWIGRALEASLPLAVMIMETRRISERPGHLTPEAADRIAPLLSMAAGFRVDAFAGEPEFCHAIVKFICVRMQFKRVMMFRMDGVRLRPCAVCWPGGDEEGLLRLLDEHPVRGLEGLPEMEFLALGRALPVDPAYTDFFDPAVSRFLACGEIGMAPLFSAAVQGSRFRGVLVADHGGRGGTLIDEGELALLETAAALVSTMLGNYELFEQLQGKAAELEAKVRELTLTSELVHILNSPRGPDVMSQDILRAVAQGVEADAGFICLLDEQQRRLHMLSRYNLSKDQVAGWEVIPVADPERLEDALGRLAADFGTFEEIVGHKPPDFLEHYIIYPLYSRREVAGLWGVGRAPGRSDFSEAERDLVATAGDQLGIAVNSLRLTHLASVDDLTALFTRRYFMDALEHELRVSRFLNYPLAMIILDADHFKMVNDTFGHQGGDEALRGLGRVLRRSTRNTDTCARVGGEEFAVLLPRVDAEQAVALAENIRRMMSAEQIEYLGLLIQITISLGVAVAQPDETVSMDGLIRRADEAMYASKAAGRDRTTLWTPEMSEQMPMAGTLAVNEGQEPGEAD